MNNCRSCIYKEQDCEYEKLRKNMDRDIFKLELEYIFEIKCNKYEKNIIKIVEDFSNI